MNAVRPQRWFFDAWSRVYDAPWVQRRTYRPLHDAVLTLLDGERPQRILDLGCGTGQLTARLAEASPRTRTVGCDFSAGMLERAAERCPRTPLVRGDAGQLPFADRTFDAIVSTEAFHWFPDQRRALAECFRVLRPGGRLLIALINTRAVPVSEVFHLGSWLLGEPFYWPSRAQMREWIGAAGFRIAAQRSIVRFGVPLLVPILTEAVRPLVAARAPAPRRRVRGRSVRLGGDAGRDVDGDRREADSDSRRYSRARRSRAGSGRVTTHVHPAHLGAH